MKIWQIVVTVALLATSAWVVVSYPPGGQVVELVNSPKPTPSREIALLFAGDIMLARSVGDMMTTKNDWTFPFERIASVTRSADLAFGNLETTISTRGTPSGCGYCFRANPRVTEGLVHAGFDVLSVANNHIHDYGADSYTDTLNYLVASNISAVGSDLVIKNIRGTRIGYLAYAYPIDEAKIIADIARANQLSDVLVVSFHAGDEYELVHNAMQERVYRAAVDAGADLVVGTHPHVVQDMEQYHGKWIAYSLGNFVFDQNWSDATRHGILLDVVVNNKRIISVSSRPIEISKQYQVAID
jgi:poly-gamma-glutamate synthesis protein (capsule biosynthesis protein)